MAKAEQQGGGAEAPTKKKKAFKKRGEKRIVHHGVRGHPGGAERHQRREDVRHALVRRAGQGPGLRPRVGDPRAADRRPRGAIDPRRHADSTQRLPSPEA
jgi:hypothetical protein